MTPAAMSGSVVDGAAAAKPKTEARLLHQCGASHTVLMSRETGRRDAGKDILEYVRLPSEAEQLETRRRDCRQGPLSLIREPPSHKDNSLTRLLSLLIGDRAK